MNDTASDYVKTAGLIGALLAAGIAINAIAVIGKARAFEQHAVGYSGSSYAQPAKHYAKKKKKKKRYYAKRAKAKTVAAKANIFDRYARVPRVSATSLANVIEPLASKARLIVTDCGSKIISAVRHTRINGSGRMSLHASGRAVDLQGNPSCIYAHLKGWAGGYSTDYGRVRHVHVSWGGPEHGRRFAHYGSRKARYVKRYRHYARAG